MQYYPNDVYTYNRCKMNCNAQRMVDTCGCKEVYMPGTNDLYFNLLASRHVSTFSSISNSVLCVQLGDVMFCDIPTSLTCALHGEFSLSLDSLWMSSVRSKYRLLAHVNLDISRSCRLQWMKLHSSGFCRQDFGYFYLPNFHLLTLFSKSSSRVVAF